ANKQRRALAEREAVNTVIQGSAADLIKLAMIAVGARLRRDGIPAKLLLQIHDELLLEAEAGAVEAAAAAVREEMEGAMRLEVPLVADTAVGDNWMQV
ncbi:MAG: DNA polymerase, partial [Planctomycetes bacterium]|nr:DNA polymerase [Planctomycetota bacterium]